MQAEMLWVGEHFTPAPSTVGLRQTGYYCRGDDYTSTTVLGLFSFFSVLILCHLTSLILLPTQDTAPTANEQAMVCSAIAAQ